MRYHWEVVAESTAKSEGGDAETVPESYPDLVTRNHEPECRFVSPAAPGNYRLFLTVTDGQGNAATANFPFRVPHPRVGEVRRPPRPCGVGE